MKTQACRMCKTLTTESTCPACGSQSFTTTWQGRITFVNTAKSFIAQQMGIEKPGEYAIKVR